MGSTALNTPLHYSPVLGRYARCVARKSCAYGDAHTSLAGLAQAGGAEVQTHGHGQVLTVSPVVGGNYSVGTAARTETYREDGTKLTPKEAEKWRAMVAALPQIEDDEPELTIGGPEGTSAQPRRAPSTARRTNPRDFFLAEKSSDPGVLAQLAYSPDWAVRLLVARNPATATDTLELLATTTDKDAKRYRDAAHEELGYRYQDMRDAAELEACARMDADGVFQKQIAEMPSYRQLAYMPAKRWARKSISVRRTLVTAAFDEAAKLARITMRAVGWTRHKMGSLTSDAANYLLPANLPRLASPLSVLGAFGSIFAWLMDGSHDPHRLGRRLRLG